MKRKENPDFIQLPLPEERRRAARNRDHKGEAYTNFGLIILLALFIFILFAPGAS